MAKGVNSHYVSRFVTTPWETEDRRLWYVDRPSGRLEGPKSSRSLFASKDALSPEIEDAFNRLIETPVAEFRRRLVAGTAPGELDWKTTRAVYLFFWLQVARRCEIDEGVPSGVDLLLLDEAQIDWYATRRHAEHGIATLRAKPGELLFVPDTGVVAFWIPDPGCVTRWTLVHGMPVHPTMMLALVSRRVTQEGFAFVQRHLQAASVGLSPTLTRVVVPPLAVEIENEKTLVDIVERAYTFNSETTGNVAKMRKCAAKIYGLGGLELGERG